MMRDKGFTLVEIAIAFGTVSVDFNRSQRKLWVLMRVLLPIVAPLSLSGAAFRPDCGSLARAGSAVMPLGREWRLCDRRRG